MKTKRILSIILALVLTLSAIPFGGMISSFGAEIWQQARGTIVTFGSYPQTRVTSSSLISALETASSSYVWSSYNYYSGTGDWDDGKMKPDSDMMLYRDFPYNGNLYREVWIKKYRPWYTGQVSSSSYTYQDDNGYYTNNVYYFKYEPLKWRILDPAEGYVMCESIIDSQAFNNYMYYNGGYYGNSSCTHYASDYANSSIRQWLNNDFYNTAFSSSEKSKIVTAEYENKSTYSSTYDSATTYDKITLLSYWDAVNSNYGFSSSYSTYDTARRAKGTDYAKCQGLYVYTGSSYIGNSYWRLRSPYYSSNTGYVDNDGYVYYYFTSTYDTDFGVRPAFKFNPKSIIYKLEKYDLTQNIVVDGKDEFIPVKFSSAMFNNSSSGFNLDLCRFSSQLVTLGYDKGVSKDECHIDTGYTYTKPNLYEALNSMGFENIEISAAAGRNNINYVLAHRKIHPSDPTNHTGKEYDLIIMGLIGSYKEQWYSNFDPLGYENANKDKSLADGNQTHRGFYDAKEYSYNKLVSYCGKYGLTNVSNNKLLIAGHSRGAATSNLLASQLIDNENIAYKDNIYTYAFATPNSTFKINKQVYQDKIFNIVNPEDFVTKCLPQKWDFHRLGTTYSLPTRINSGRDYIKAGGYHDKMEEKFKAMTNGIACSVFKDSEKDAFDTVSKMASTVTSAKSMYTDSSKMKCGYGEKNAFEFFQTTLCPCVAEKSGSSAFMEGLKNMIVAYLSPTTSDTYRQITEFFLKNEGAAMLNEKITSEGNAVATLTVPGLLLFLGAKFGITGIVSSGYVVAKAEKLLSWARNNGHNFADGHRAETYCAYVMSMTEAQIKKPKSGLNGFVNCPVDIEIYDKETGELVGKIVDNQVDETVASKENAVVMSVDGDSKQFWLASDGDYDIKLIGNDDGKMDYSISEINEDAVTTQKLNFFDVKIENGKTYTADVSSDEELDEYTLTSPTGTEVKPSENMTNEEIVYYNITTSVEGNGIATESMSVESGSYVTLTAEPDEGNTFIGWYDGSTLISSEKTYSFVAKGDVSYKAKFAVTPQINSDCEALTVNVGETKQLPMTVVNPDKAYFNGKMHMNDVRIASATSSNGIIYIKGVGVGETKFRLYFNEKITGKTVAYKDFTIKIVNTPTTVSMIKSLELNYKDDYTFKPKIETADGVTYKTSYKSSNTGVASASDNGYIYACGKGDTKITCTVTDSNGNTVTASCNVTVRYAWWQWLIKILLFGWIWY